MLSQIKPHLYWNIQKFPSPQRHQAFHFPVREELTLLSMFRQLSSPSDIVSSFDCCWATPEAMESGQNLCTGRFWAVFFFVFGVSEQLESSIGWRIRLLALINLNTIKGKVNLGSAGCKFPLSHIHKICSRKKNIRNIKSSISQASHPFKSVEPLLEHQHPSILAN